MGSYRVLIVDDDKTIRNLLGRYLKTLGYIVELAENTAQAMERVGNGSFDLVLTDVRMPGPDGIHLLTWLTIHRPEIAVVLLSGCDDVKLAVNAMKSGARDYLLKPFSLEEVADTVGKAIAVQKAKATEAQHLLSLERTVNEQSGALRSTLQQLHDASQDTLDALVTALDARERETQSHSQRVSEYSVRLARVMGIAGSDLDVIRQGSILHDIGKIGIPDRILLKPDSLTREEWSEMRKHPEIGSWIVGSVESLKPASEIVIAHHERFDGSGYPYGLRGEEIPFGARVFAVADTLDAVLSDRPYRSGQSYGHAREEIQNNAGTQFDPQVAQCFLSIPQVVWDEIRGQLPTKQSANLVLT